MSLNDVYTQKYVPTRKSEALAYIDLVLSEAEENVESELHGDPRKIQRSSQTVANWKRIHSQLESGEIHEGKANQFLKGSKLPPIEDGYEPSDDNLVEWRLQGVEFKLDYNLLSALRDALVK